MHIISTFENIFIVISLIPFTYSTVTKPPTEKTPDSLRRICSHPNNLQYYCPKDNTFICKECAKNQHSNHLNDLKPISSFMESHYLDIYRKYNLLSKFIGKNSTMNSSNKQINTTKQKLQEAYKSFIGEIIDYEKKWVEENYNKIADMGGIMEQNNKDIENENIYRDIRILMEEGEYIYKNFLYYSGLELISKDNLLSLEKGVEFNNKYELIMSQVRPKESINNKNKNKNIPEFKINIHVNPIYIREMTKLEDNYPIFSKYKGQLLNKKNYHSLITLIPTKYKIIEKLQLLYTSENNPNKFSAGEFHSRCDGIGNTLIILQINNPNSNSNSNYIFGGFSTPNWHSLSEYSEDIYRSSFLFDFMGDRVRRYEIVDYRRAIYGDGGMGPVFGEDIRVGDGGRGDVHWGNMGGCYQGPRGNLASAHSFLLIDYEVHQVIFS